MALVWAAAQAIAEESGEAFDARDDAVAETEEEGGLVVEIEIESSTEFERNLDLIDAEEADFAVGELEFAVGVEYETERFAAEIVFVLANESPLKDDTQEENGITKLEIEEALVTFNDVIFDGFSVELGRLNFRDDRMWLYDRKFDAVKLAYEFGDRFALTLARSKDAIDNDLFNNRQRSSIRNISFIGEYAVTDDVSIGGYAVRRQDPAQPGFRPLHLGLRSRGSIGRTRYWLDLGHVRGKEEGVVLDGYAADLGAIYIFDQPLQPSLTLGYAWASGDSSPEAGKDRSFRQTGLHRNQSQLNGLSRFKHYGEVFDPELSNMRVLTAGVGFRNGDNASLDLVFHNYHLQTFAEELRDTGVDGELDSSFQSKNLGSELDLIFTRLGFSRLENLGVEFAIGYFRPGNAFSSETKDDAMLLRFGIAYAFGKDKGELFKR